VNSSEARRLGEEAAQRLARTEFEFADDHRAFLAAGLPLNSPEPGRRRSSWPDWRDADPGDLRERLGWPVEGALFDVEHNALWHPSWGQRPADTGEALRAARQRPMVPFWSDFL
jgi:hypothetical protein